MFLRLRPYHTLRFWQFLSWGCAEFSLSNDFRLNKICLYLWNCTMWRILGFQCTSRRSSFIMWKRVAPLQLRHVMFSPTTNEFAYYLNMATWKGQRCILCCIAIAVHCAYALMSIFNSSKISGLIDSTLVFEGVIIVTECYPLLLFGTGAYSFYPFSGCFSCYAWSNLFSRRDQECC